MLTYLEGDTVIYLAKLDRQYNKYSAFALLRLNSKEIKTFIPFHYITKYNGTTSLDYNKVVLFLLMPGMIL